MVRPVRWLDVKSWQDRDRTLGSAPTLAYKAAMNGNKQIVRGWTRAQSRQGRRMARPVIAASLIGALIGCGQAWCVALVIGRALTGAEIPSLAIPVVVFVVLAAVRAVLMATGDIMAARAGEQARARLRGEIVASMLRVGPSLLRRSHSGALASLAFDRVEALDGFFARWIPASVLWIAQPFLVGVVVACVSPSSALVLLCCGLFVPFAQAVFGIGAARASRSQFLAMTRLQARFLDRIRGIATIVLAGRSQHEAERLAQSAAELRQRTMRVLRVAFLSSAAIDLAMVVALVLVAVHNGQALLHLRSAGGVDSIAVVRALFALILVPEFFAPLRSLALAYQDRAHASGAAESISELFGTTDAAETALPDTSWLKSLGGSVAVTFDDVGFSWAEERGPSVQGVSFHVAVGDILLLCGASGAGKSTLIELLLGFVAPDTGRILFNGRDAAGLTPQDRSQLISWIGQKPMLFAGTVRENLLLGRPDADEAALRSALQAAAAETFVMMLPQGLDTLIGEGGFGVSGGQAQRIAIARAFLRDAPVLVLDEPTAHLDPVSEAEVFEALRRLSAHRTVIVASHSKAISQLAGRRLDLEHGQIRRGRIVA